MISVLLADDHAVVRQGLRLLLEGQDDLSVVGEAGDGRESVREANRLRPDVILMDISMPGLNGIEATRMILEANPQTRVIILSMHAHSEFIYRALHAGAAGYLVKETVADEVIKAVRAVHLGRRYLSETISDTIVEDYIKSRVAVAVEDPLERLSVREREVLQLIVEGKSNPEIADIVALSPKTVETYRSRMMQKLGISTIPELVKFAIQHGLTGLE